MDKPMIARMCRGWVLGLAALASACASEHASGPTPGDALAKAQAENAAESPPSPTARVRIAPGAYAAAFDGGKAAIRDLGFLLERVDAQSGVIATKPLGSAGMATPWDRQQTDLDQEVEDLFQRQQRVVRVEFVPASEGEGGPDTAATSPTTPDDLRALNGPLEARVQVVIMRQYYSGLRINTHSIGLSTWTVDEDLSARGMMGYSVAHKQDRRLAERIAGAIDKAARAATTAAH